MPSGEKYITYIVITRFLNYYKKKNKSFHYPRESIVKIHYAPGEIVLQSYPEKKVSERILNCVIRLLGVLRILLVTPIVLNTFKTFESA